MDTEDPWDGDDGDALGAEIMERLRLRGPRLGDLTISPRLGSGRHRADG
jgi:hypothetical protein